MTRGSTTKSTPSLWFGLALAFVAAVLPAQQETEREVAEAVDGVLATVGTARSAADLAQARGELLALSRRLPVSEYPHSAIRSRALVEAGALGRRTGDAAKAAGELLRVLEREAESEWTPRAHYELGELLLTRGDWQGAVDHLRLAREGWLRQAAGANPATGLADAALNRMTLIHRLILRPLAGREPWRRSRPYLPAQAGIERPRGVAAKANGELLVTEPNRAAILDPDGSPSSARDLRGIVRPSHGSGGVGSVITADGITRLPDLVTASFNRPQGGTLDRIVAAHQDEFGNWTLLSRRTAEVLRYDPDGRPIETLRLGTMNQPIDLAVGEDGAVHVLDAGSRSQAATVHRFGRNGDFEESFRADWDRPTAVDVDPFGNRYVLDAASLQVLVYDPHAVPIATIGPVLPSAQELRAPEDIAVDARGRIFIADSRLGAVLVVE